MLDFVCVAKTKRTAGYVYKMTSKGGIDVGLMDNGSRKRRREDVENDEEESDIIIVLLISLVAVLGAWYHNKYFIKEVPVKNDNALGALDGTFVNLTVPW
ncbi:alpha/beta-Hydrolases superfamily protein [Striga asiatica]|uniref:Alpha/beta-Hydrolases superfamily protein n=1 Tax=Striga asiatica TaxID=4170 RepID=A0A5A7PA07_STRAF|nr:alpha/beta-Hydrolases superfamily protein [Striga asiatica]